MTHEFTPLFLEPDGSVSLEETDSSSLAFSLSDVQQGETIRAADDQLAWGSEAELFADGEGFTVQTRIWENRGGYDGLEFNIDERHSARVFNSIEEFLQEVKR